MVDEVSDMEILRNIRRKPERETLVTISNFCLDAGFGVAVCLLAILALSGDGNIGPGKILLFVAVVVLGVVAFVTRDQAEKR